MATAEGSRRVSRGPREIISWIRDIPSRRKEGKERKTIEGLPPVFLRLFGEIDYAEQLSEIPEKLKQKVVVLTTSDTPDQVVDSLKSDGWAVARSATVDIEAAKTNSGLLLNEGLRYAREQGETYAFFLASGFQRHLGSFYSMYYETAKEQPEQDAYFFVLPETHQAMSLQTHSELNWGRENTERFLVRGFPYETALVMSTKMPEFETNLSKKGAMGSTDEAIPLGGMEFLLTLFDAYKQGQNAGKVFIPKMVGITVPILMRSSERLIDFYSQTHEVPQPVLDSLALAPSVEVTSTRDKEARRVATFTAAMQALGLTDQDIRTLFSQTQFELGITRIGRFRDGNKLII